MSQKPTISFLKSLAPRFWPTWLGLALLRLINILHYGLQLAIGKNLGTILRMFQKRRVHIARRNLELCFPDKTMVEIETLLRKHFESLGMALIESAMSWWADDETISRLATITGSEYLQHALDSGKGVILLTGHLTSMELSVHILSTRYHISAMYRHFKNPVMDRLIGNARRRRLDAVFPRSDVKMMIKSLKEGKAVWYGFDQDYGMRHSIFVPFFGIPAATITTTSRFAKIGNALVVPYFPYRKEDGKYHIEILPALRDFPSGNIEKDTRRLNKLLEEVIMKAPEQYLWIHRRFKTRPEHSKPIY